MRAVALPTAGRSPSTSTGIRPAKAAWSIPSQPSFPPTTCDVGNDFGSLVTRDYPASGPKFTGEVKWVEIDLGKNASE